MRTRTWTTAALATVLLAPAVAACGSGAGAKAPASRELKRVTFAAPNMTTQIFAGQARNFAKAGKQIGVDVQVYDNSGDAATAITNANLMVSRKPDLLVEFAPIADATSRISAIFKRSGIPCVAVNVRIDGCGFFNFDQKYLAEAQAQVIAQKMTAKGWNGGNTTILLEQASKLGPSVNIAVTWFYQQLVAKVPGFTKVRSEEITPSTTTIAGREGLQADGGVDIDRGFTATAQALQTIPADRNVVVYTVNDDTAIGALRAVKAARREGKAMIAGYGATQPAIDAMRTRGPWVSSAKGFWEDWGEFILAMGTAILQGKKVPDLTAPPMVAVTPDNLDKVYAPGMTNVKRMPPLPEGSRYLLETGVLQRFGNVEGA
ncbi:sugar ABC transporter substrate-binding protein [Actinomadura roseirufa]|uniref:sugar ABC transporter substrate-binding protein n=1 Tax=Actinomadura roseirufa TaxID=2094049 RepID=UPI0013F15C8E|nr:sugar ABC transporter substrate-binding protein [Actinomadura roseirufa]